jgi:hypothetical protein
VRERVWAGPVWFGLGYRLLKAPSQRRAADFWRLLHDDEAGAFQASDFVQSGL